MHVQFVPQEDKNHFNILASHPLQCWQWGEFRQNTGVKVIRLGSYEHNKLTQTIQMTLHPIPHTKWTIGYIPKSTVPGKQMLDTLREIGAQYHCIFIKMEPNIQKNDTDMKYLTSFSDIHVSAHPLFTHFSFQLDLTKTEDELLKNMQSKTRYNIRIAQKHNVVVQEDDSDEAFQHYLNLMMETTKRQRYFAHTASYHKLMWQTLKKENIAHLLTATFNQNNKTHTLVSWVLFLFNNVLYYPYGASSSLFRNVMASNAMMWETIRFGKKYHAELFDMWGSLGPNPNSQDPWYGFHRFKQGFGATLVEFLGSFDLVISPFLYHVYNNLHVLRSLFLKMKSAF
jgi:lipid II:glycine glycyltransferase (peptidoglycan interpeptide bridge formation enzyme)